MLCLNQNATSTVFYKLQKDAAFRFWQQFSILETDSPKSHAALDFERVANSDSRFQKCRQQRVVTRGTEQPFFVCHLVKTEHSFFHLNAFPGIICGSNRVGEIGTMFSSCIWIDEDAKIVFNPFPDGYQKRMVEMHSHTSDKLKIVSLELEILQKEPKNKKITVARKGRAKVRTSS